MATLLTFGPVLPLVWLAWDAVERCHPDGEHRVLERYVVLCAILTTAYVTELATRDTFAVTGDRRVLSWIMGLSWSVTALQVLMSLHEHAACVAPSACTSAVATWILGARAFEAGYPGGIEVAWR